MITEGEAFDTHVIVHAMQRTLKFVGERINLGMAEWPGGDVDRVVVWSGMPARRALARLFPHGRGRCTFFSKVCSSVLASMVVFWRLVSVKQMRPEK